MELTILIVRGELREGVYLVRDEVDLVLGADLHQLQCQLPAVDLHVHHGAVHGHKLHPLVPVETTVGKD